MAGPLFHFLRSNKCLSGNAAISLPEGVCPLRPHVFPHTATQTGGQWPPLRLGFVMCGTRRQERCRAVAYLNTSSVCVRDKPTVCNGRFALPQGRLVVGAATGRPWKVSKCSKPHEEERNMRRKKATFPVGRTFAHLRCANGAAVPEGRNFTMAEPLFHFLQGAALSVLMFFLTQQHKRAVFVVYGAQWKKRRQALTNLNTSSVCAAESGASTFPYKGKARNEP